MTQSIEPFRCDVPQSILDDMKARLQRTRLPDQLTDAGWDYGTERSFLDRLCTYWHDEFDWRSAEARFNRFAQYTTQIDGENVHFYHVRSPEPDAVPLIITHGFPGSVAEFLDIIGPLSDPAAHGGDRRDAFHVVAPSIPGYGFSGPTRTKGFGLMRAAAVNSRIMEVLGYGRYFAQGGDFGSAISSRMAMLHPDRMIGLHLNFILGKPADPDKPLAGLTERETAALQWKSHYDDRESGYQSIQSTKPQTLAYGLTDSPAGLAAWISEKFRTWTDCDGDVEALLGMDRMLENIMLYWVTGTINSAMRLYYESIGPDRAATPEWQKIEVPTGHARFPAEIRPTPRLWAEQMYNIVHWNELPKGGHFAALEQPALLVDDVRKFCRSLR